VHVTLQQDRDNPVLQAGVSQIAIPLNKGPSGSFQEFSNLLQAEILNFFSNQNVISAL